MSGPTALEETKALKPAPQRLDAKGGGLATVGMSAMAALQVTFGLMLLLVWQVASGWLVDPFFISSPSAVIARLWNWFSDGGIFVHIWATVYATLIGFFIGSALGIAGGIWRSTSRKRTPCATGIS